MTLAPDTHLPNARLELIALTSIPSIVAGCDLAQIIAAALAHDAIDLRDGDILVIAQKIVSKAEGRRVRLDEVTPTAAALDLARRTHKDPRLVELILRESNEVIRVGREVIIVEHRLGFVLANAGVDQSNVSESGADDEALLLPMDPDGSALALRQRLGALCRIDPAIIINDSWGRAWRMGVVGHAIGVAGLNALVDCRGRRDRNGRLLRATEVALADELAAAGSLLMGQADEGRPVVLVRGLTLRASAGEARALLRPKADDLFR